MVAITNTMTDFEIESCDTSKAKSLDTLSSRLNYALKRFNVSQAELGRRIGVKQQAIQYLCSSHAEKSKFTLEMADALNISSEWLATGRGVMQPEFDPRYASLNSQKQVPLYSPGDLQQVMDKSSSLTIENYIYTDAEISERAFAFVVDDQSMFPRFSKGTLIVVDPKMKPSESDFVLAQVPVTGEFIFRQFILVRRKAQLSPLNLKSYKPMPLPDVKIIGVMREARMKF